jgi:hypothetical protein
VDVFLDEADLFDDLRKYGRVLHLAGPPCLAHNRKCFKWSLKGGAPCHSSRHASRHTHAFRELRIHGYVARTCTCRSRNALIANRIFNPPSLVARRTRSYEQLGFRGDMREDMHQSIFMQFRSAMRATPPHSLPRFEIFENSPRSMILQ